MASSSVSTADDRTEEFSSELGLSEYQLVRALARLPQDARYALSRTYGIGCVPVPSGRLMVEMDLSPREFTKLHNEALARLRVMVGSGQPR